MHHKHRYQSTWIFIKLFVFFSPKGSTSDRWYSYLGSRWKLHFERCPSNLDFVKTWKKKKKKEKKKEGESRAERREDKGSRSWFPSRDFFYLAPDNWNATFRETFLRLTRDIDKRKRGPIHSLDRTDLFSRQDESLRILLSRGETFEVSKRTVPVARVNKLVVRSW